MSVRLRLQRHGTKKRPYYRLVATDQRNMRDGRFLEILGTYNPLVSPPEVLLKQDRIDHWVGNGAQMSETVAALVRAKKRAG